MALKNDGTLWAWGANYQGRLGNGSFSAPLPVPTQIGTDANWSFVSAGTMHTMALKSDGTLWAWGYAWMGQLGLGSMDHKNVPTQVGTDTDWFAVEAGEWHTMALKGSGTLWTWGWGYYGQLGDGSTQTIDVPTQVGTDTNWSGIAAGSKHSLGMKSDNTVFAWGNNANGTLGDGTLLDRHLPVQIAENVVGTAVAAEGSHSLLLNDGKLLSWGYSINGALGTGMLGSNKADPVQVMGNVTTTAMSAGSQHSTAIWGGSLWTWGQNYRGQLGDGTSRGQEVPLQIGVDTDWSDLSAGTSYTLGVKTGGSLWAWGNNHFCQLGFPNGAWDVLEPTRIGTDSNWTAVFAGGANSRGLKSDGTLWTWGYYWCDLPLPDTVPTQVGTDVDWADMVIGGAFTILLKTDGSLWSWETDDWGGGDIVRIGTETDWTGIAQGHNHTVGVKTDGSLWSWGENWQGQLGDGTSGGSNLVPTRIGVDLDWLAVSASEYHTLGLKTDGSLWLWGSYLSGVDTLVPTRIGTGTEWVQIEAGGNHDMATKSDNTLWTWGSNVFGQLGDGTAWEEFPVQITNAANPTPSITANGVVVAVGDVVSVSLALDARAFEGAGGELWFWRDNDAPQLIYSDLLFSFAPFEIENTTTLTLGTHTYHFVVDLTQDGVIDSTLMDSLDITVQQAVPIPDIKANGSDGPLVFSAGDQVGVSLALDAQSYQGVGGELWFWRDGEAPQLFYNGLLYSFSPFDMVNSVTLPSGTYTYHFVVDLTQDGVLDSTLADLVEITVLQTAPIPDIKVNGSDGPLVLSVGEQAIVALSFDAGSAEGMPGELWGQWVWEGTIVEETLILNDLFYTFPSFEALNTTDLQPGVYTFHLIADFNQDGIIDATSPFENSVTVTVQ